MSDLLVMSPNIMYSRTLEHDSATVLRDRALRFWNIDRTLSRNDPDPIQSVTKLALPIPAIPDTATIVPGTHHVVYISYHGSVHLVSLLTGEQVDRVDPANSIDELYPVLNICPSATYGTVCHIVASYRTGLVFRLISPCIVQKLTNSNSALIHGTTLKVLCGSSISKISQHPNSLLYLLLKSKVDQVTLQCPLMILSW